MRRAALALLLAASAVAADEARDALPPEDRARLAAGEVLVDEIRTDEAGGAARVRAAMRRPVQAIWAVVVSCEAARRYLQGLRECEVLEDAGTRARVRQAVRRHWFLPTTEFTYRVERKPYDRMTLALESGEVDALEGAWRFEPFDDDLLLVTHEIRVEPRLPAPRWLVRAAIRGDLPDMLACIRGLAGASLDEARAATDRAHCAPVTAQR